MSVRKLGLVLAVACAALLVVPVAAGAQTTAAPIQATSLSNVPVTGKAHNGKAFNGHFDVSQFVTRNGKTYAVGTLTGKLGNRSIKRSNVAIPASMGSGTTGSSISHAVTPPATCPVLNLVLGPLHLNLLGLQVDLNQVVLNITAVPGAGNLLGNLLCAVTNLLNGTGGLASLSALLNEILAALGL